VAEPLPFDRCLAVIDSAARELVERAESAGLAAPVPTCPEWSMAELVAHQGMVHRWATSHVRHDGADIPSEQEIVSQVPADELLAWFTEGARDLLVALRLAEPDGPAMVFLADAPPPVHFWARRQAHETTIHAVDALAAALGREPAAKEAGVDTEVALDGLDELLTGFFPRGRSKLAHLQPLTISVVPSDGDRDWTVQVADERLSTVRDRQEDAQAIFAGTAAELYLGLWNRGNEVLATGRPGVLEAWRTSQRIRWG
jgi:uncharacterized protein (TIGR03083 family)